MSAKCQEQTFADKVKQSAVGPRLNQRVCAFSRRDLLPHFPAYREPLGIWACAKNLMSAA